METRKSKIGILRGLLVFFTLIISLTGLFAVPSSEIKGWPIITSIVAPSLAVMIVFTLILDLVMNSIFRIDSSAHEKDRLLMIIKVECSCLLILVLCWAPFVNQLFLDTIF